MKKSDGFTIIELMISLVLVGILVAVALPDYREYVLRSNRSDAQAALLDMASRQERFVAQRNTYTTEVSGNNGLAMQTTESSKGYYDLSVQACAGGTIDECYLLIAEANGSQRNDADCLRMTYDSRGRRGGTTANCW